MEKTKHTQGKYVAEREAAAKLASKAPELLKTLQELTGGIANQIKHDEISPANVILYKNALKVIERATA
jgi:hypothetical protein